MSIDRMSKTAVIILNWNGVSHGLIRQYLPSVVKYTRSEDTQVIVADNGSTDASLQVLAEEFPSVRVIALDKNYGFAEGYNRAIKTVSEEEDAPDYVVLLNDDVRVTPNWLEPLTAYMDSHHHCAGLQPKLLKDFSGLAGMTALDQDYFEYAGACGGYLDNLCYPYCRGRIFDQIEEDHGQYDLPAGEVWPVMWATGACLMVRTQAYLQAGGLDHRFFAHMEEIDLCWRLRRMGYELVCVPQSKVYHKGGASLPQGNPKKTKLNFRNSLVMMWKNLPAEHCNRTILKRKLLDGVAALNFLVHGEFKQVWAIYQAHREASKMIRTQYTASELVGFGKAPVFKQEKISILFQFYLCNKKRYSEIF